MTTERTDQSVDRPIRTALFMAVLLGIPHVAPAAHINYETGVALWHSDNINLSQLDEDDETVLAPELRFDIDQLGATLQLLARGDIQYLDYLGDTFDDELRGELAGQANWTLSPGRLNWVLEDYLTNQPVDLLTGFTPENQQQVNVLITGPSLFVRFGPATRGQLDLRYSNSYAEENESFNGDRYSVAAHLLRELNATDDLSMTVEASEADFDASLPGAQYSRYDGYISYGRRLKSLVLRIDLGYSQLDLADGLDNESAPLARGSLDWSASPSSTFSADLAYQFADAAQDLVSRGSDMDTPISELENAQVAVRPEVFREHRIELVYTFTGERTLLRAGPRYQRVDYQTSLSPDQTNETSFVAIDYRLRPGWQLSLQASHENRNYDDRARRDRDNVIGAGVTYEASSHWVWRFDVEHRERNSSAAGQDYDENVALVSFSYRR